MAEVKLGGVWLHSLGHVSDIKWSSQWGTGACGPALASCSLAVAPGNDSTLLGLSRTFEVWDAGVKVFGGPLAEMGRGFPRSLSARGWASRGGDFDARTGNPQTAVSQAIAAGLPWTNAAAFPSVTIGGSDRLGDLLTAWAITTGSRWGVDANAVAFTATDPTTPTWFLDASDLDIGVADDGLYTRVRATYVSAVDGTTGETVAEDTAEADDAAGQAVYGVIEYPMDLTPLGLLSASTAATYAQQQLTLLTVPQWLSRVTTNSQRLLTAGGLPAYLPSVKAGQMVRLFNVPNNLGGLRGELGLDVVLGEVEYDTTSPAEVTLAPVNLAVRNLADALAQAARSSRPGA